MPYPTHNGHSTVLEASVEEAFAETPFADPTAREQEEPLHESSLGEALDANFEFSTPFLPGESSGPGEFEVTTQEVAALSEITAELKDSLFREALEQLADEALEAHSAQLSGEYGEHETRDRNAERILSDHFEPLSAEAEAMLDRFFERLEAYETESLTDTEIERISTEVL